QQRIQKEAGALQIAALRPSDTSATPFPAPLPQLAVLDQFEPITLSSLFDAVRHLQPSNCPSDCLPSRLLKDATVFDTVAPFLLLLINIILSSGCVPAAFKHAVVQPLQKKKPNLDPSILSNFRPISKLPFLSKVLEREVYVQLKSFLTNNNIYEKFQSGFRTAHSTETALLRVLNDLLLAADSGSPVILVLLDLTAAFDTVDHRILLSRLEQHVGIKGTALKFFQLYLAERTFSVQLGDSTSSVAPLTCGVPQGSILGPILFLLYILPLGEILVKHNISFHCFADDIQLYLPLRGDGQGALHPLLDCLADIKAWMGANFFNLNESKTEIIVFGKSSTGFSTDALGRLASNIRPSVRNLGVIFDSAFMFKQQVSAVVRKSFFHMRTLAKIKSYLPQSDLERVIHAFITSQLDYCNALYTVIDQSQLRRLQLVQNSADRLLTCTKKREHITPVLASLHWLPIRY
uniref:Reverse transcriptase domain-containing protein n=1 Tax=Scophthalmus maximus TaxID=52904 RepID=A0A8D3EFU3_SCOMX